MEQFVSHARGIVVNVEAILYLYRFEVRAERTVSTSGDGDEASVVHARVTLLRNRGWVFDEPEMIVLPGIDFRKVFHQNTHVVLSGFHASVVQQHRLQVDAQFCGFFKKLTHFKNSFRENPRSHTRDPPHNLEVRLTFGLRLTVFLIVWYCKDTEG